MLSPRQLVAVWLVIGFHATINLVTIALPVDVENDSLFLLGVPIAQASLIAIWLSLSRWRAYLRIPLAALGLIGTWVVTMDLLRDFTVGSAVAAAWASMFAVQAAIIICLITAGRVLRWLFRSARDLQPGGAQPLKVTYLLVSVAALMMVVVVVRQGVHGLGWTRDVTQWQYFYVFPVLGVYNALSAVTLLALVMNRRWCVPGAVVGVASAALQGVSGPHLLATLLGTEGALSVVQFMALTGSQAICLAVTLVPLRLMNCFGTSHHPQVVDAVILED